MGDQSAIAEVFRGVDTHAHTHHAAVIDSAGPPRRQAKAEKPASEGPEQGQCPHIKAKTPLTCGNTVPEVGLEPHSRPCKHWELQKTSAIRASPADVRPNPKPKVCTLCTPPFCHIPSDFEQLPRSPDRGGAALCCAGCASCWRCQWSAADGDRTECRHGGVQHKRGLVIPHGCPSPLPICHGLKRGDPHDWKRRFSSATRSHDLASPQRGTPQPPRHLALRTLTIGRRLH
jgi:hypothetical protein